MEYRTRRLTDKILVAFHHACDLQDHESAEQLLRTLENLIGRLPATPENRWVRDREWLIGAHQRLWQLRHKELP